MDIKKRKNENTRRFRSILEGKDGEFILEMVDEMTGYKQNQFTPDPYCHAFNAGLRQSSVNLHELLEMDMSVLDLKGTEK